MTDKKTLKLSAVCGLFCPSCTVYIATKEDPDRLRMIAKQLGVSADEMKCDGCRSDRRAFLCRSCEFVACAQEKKLDFCNACDSFPCDKLKAFKSQRPHRIELWRDNDRIKEVGFETWFNEMKSNYSCLKCGVLNSAYDIACRKCSEDPASEFAAKHGDAIRAHLNKINSSKG